MTLERIELDFIIQSLNFMHEKKKFKTDFALRLIERLSEEFLGEDVWENTDDFTPIVELKKIT